MVALLLDVDGFGDGANNVGFLCKTSAKETGNSKCCEVNKVDRGESDKHCRRQDSSKSLRLCYDSVYSLIESGLNDQSQLK